jgi:hypothetical protein
MIDSSSDEKEILKKCAKVYESRAQQYGDAKKLHSIMGNLISVQLGVDCTATDAALIMVQLKLARIAAGNINEDTFIDAINYMKIAWECQE